MTVVDEAAGEQAERRDRSKRPANLLPRLIGLGIDVLAVLVAVQLLVALIFFATNGAMQGSFWLGLRLCGPVDMTVLPPAPAGIKLVEDCNDTVFGIPTGRDLTVEEEGQSRRLALTPRGTLQDPLTEIQWIYLPILLVYLITFETLRGTTLGKRLSGLRVRDIAQPSVKGIPVARAFMRNLVLLPVLLWCVGSTLWLTLTRKPEGGFSIFFEFHLGWIGLLALFSAAVIVVAILLKEPIQDRIAGTEVINDRADQSA